MSVVVGGLNIYGYDIGVIMLESRFPRLVGDIGNAKTFSFPVKYEIVKGYKPHNVVLELSLDDVKPFVKAAQQLEEHGVKAITTSCGFLALFQEEIAKCISIPFFSSALILLPFVSKMIGDRKVLVVTANSDSLTKDHLVAVCGVLNDDCKYDIVGTQKLNTFTNFTVQNWNAVDAQECENDLLNVINDAFIKNDYGAILLECTNMPPFSDVIRKQFNVPVFDIVSLMNFIYATLNPNSYSKQGIYFL